MFEILQKFVRFGLFVCLFLSCQIFIVRAVLPGRRCRLLLIARPGCKKWIPAIMVVTAVDDTNAGGSGRDIVAILHLKYSSEDIYKYI